MVLGLFDGVFMKGLYQTPVSSSTGTNWTFNLIEETTASAVPGLHTEGLVQNIHI